MSDRVRAYRQQMPRYFPLPHPSWRTTAWKRRKSWFEADALPVPRAAVARALEDDGEHEPA